MESKLVAKLRFLAFRTFKPKRDYGEAQGEEASGSSARYMTVTRPLHERYI